MAPADRIAARGKFLHAGGERFLLKGVTYGTFAPDARGAQFPALERIAGDFAAMAACGVNTVRVYTVPSIALLDEAGRHGLRVMVGIPWAQHVAFLDDAPLRAGIRRHLLDTVHGLADHPAVLLFALGNEIPAGIVRWHGRERIERFLGELYDEAKAAAPDSLFTYVNFPPTEFLDLPFLDVCAFNVYLHDEASLRKYLARLQHVAGNKPLLLAEAGADSIRHGEEGQAELTAMQLRASFAEGACGAIAFAWTDEWWRGGSEIADWSFGLVDAARRPKPAMAAVADVFATAPFSPEERRTWPRVSVVVCAYNASATLDDCLSSLNRLTYPDFEIVVVNDGSTDATGAMARRYDSMRVLDIANGGLSGARNVGLSAATGEIVVYVDADVRVEPDWLSYLVQPFVRSDVVACGGPNVAPEDDPWLARVVALSPGGPLPVMLDDRLAEHVPGCNFAVRREALLAIAGFNPIYRRAGDDVDVCWRLQARGGRIGFSPGALVWHHHRPSIKAYWRQQKGYGEGEAWLIPHHPDKFVAGQTVWHGRLYSPLPFIRSLSRTRIDAGVWGTAAFPSVYRPGVHPMRLLPYSPGWTVGSLVLLAGAAVALRAGLPGLAAAFFVAGAAGVLTAVGGALSCAFATDARMLPQIPGLSTAPSRLIVRFVIAWLHLLQPLAREVGWYKGRFAAAEEVPSHPVPSSGRRWSPTWADARSALRACVGRSTDAMFWGETWTSNEAVLKRVIKRLRGLHLSRHIAVDDGWQLDRDVSMPLGIWAWLDLRALVEEHGAHRSLLRVRNRLRLTPVGLLSVWVTVPALVALFLTVRGLDWRAGAVALMVGAALIVGVFWQLTCAMAGVRRATAKAAGDVHMYRVAPAAAQPRHPQPAEPRPELDPSAR